MTEATHSAPAPSPSAIRLDRSSWAWVGVAPFLLFAVLFLIAPTFFLIIGAFQDADGHFTLRNISNLFQPSIIASYWISIQISAASAIIGAIIGFFMAYAVVLGGLPGWLRPTLMTFSGVASNFAGLPLAFAFLATLGRTGLVTVFLVKWFDFNPYAHGFNLLSFWGLTITYLYFQIPLMVLILTPALDGLKRNGARPRRSWAPRPGSTGAMSPCRSCGPACSAPPCCCLPILRGDRHGLRPHRLVAQHRDHPALRPDPRRRAA